MTIVSSPFFAAALTSLTERHRQVLALHDHDRLSAERVASTLGMSCSEVRIALREARLVMGQRLTGRLQTAA
jgi:DNA-directed RNA polymerase specialized sigma24 family protein